MSQALHAQITTRSITSADVFAIKDTDVRMAALKYLGSDWVFNNCESTLINESARGNKLYSIDGLTGSKEWCLRYRCPSTGREYVSFVDPQIGQKKNADLAMASKFKLTEKQYAQVLQES